ncbi:hypothetical protein ACR9YC_08525 [Parasphingorhabdus sp. DH2-15]|jgi:peroxiredoxin family protein
MNQMDFVIAAYALGVSGTIFLTAYCLSAMRRAEQRLEETRRK